jgi:hypothetical protein
LEEAWNKIKLDVSHFRAFGSVTWAHIPNEKRKPLQPKSEKCIFVGYFEDVKGYKLLQPHSNEIIIRRYVKFDENIFPYEPDLTFVLSLAHDLSSTFVPSYVPILFYSSSNDENEDKNPSSPTHLPPDESIEYEPTLAP